MYLALVLSTKAHANIKHIDPNEALAVKGVHAFFSAKDISSPEFNKHGAIIHDEEIFVSKTVIIANNIAPKKMHKGDIFWFQVTCQGQVLGAVVADNQMIAQRAAKLVKVEYEEIAPIIITIDVIILKNLNNSRLMFCFFLQDAIRENSYFEQFKPRLTKNNFESGIREAENALKGEVHMAGQEHFYLETHCSLAIPKEDNEIEIFCSTQNPSEIQVIFGRNKQT